MWRSLFYAVGIGLFSLGLQTLVLDHVQVEKNTKLQRLVRKILEDDTSAAAGKRAAPQNVERLTPDWQQQNPQYLSGIQGTGSRFGPSRFAGSAYGVGYGGPRVTNSPTPQRSFGSGTGNAQFAGFRSGVTAPQAGKKPVLQKIKIREWMPWCLLASGAIIFLYTNTLHRRKSHD